jgi:hypothetical protein
MSALLFQGEAKGCTSGRLGGLFPGPGHPNTRVNHAKTFNKDNSET